MFEPNVRTLAAVNVNFAALILEVTDDVEALADSVRADARAPARRSRPQAGLLVD
jgi:hypothetical protein